MSGSAEPSAGASRGPVDVSGSLFGFVVGHPVAVLMMSCAALVFGWVSYQRLALELMPDISYPTITVRTTWEGAAPQEVEAQVSRPVEEALATLDGLVRIESRSRAGSSDVVLGFGWGVDMSAASQAIRENLQTTFLPDGTDRPLILRYDPSLDPFVRLALSLDQATVEQLGEARALARLRELGENELKRELEGLPGVAAVRVRGGLEREIRVEIVEDWLAARQVTLDQVRRALVAENVNLAGGSVIEGDTEYLVRTLNEYQQAGELSTLMIRRDDGVLVPLPDVARIDDGHKLRELISRLDGGEAVEVEVFKEADANVVTVARRLHERLHGNGLPVDYGGVVGLLDGLPEGMSLVVLDNQATFIEDAINNLRDTAMLGGVLAVGILFLFLRDFRATGIIGIAIPLSLIVGFSPLYMLGVSLNLMSLGGLALGIGMLVDNAVVVLESIQRYRDEGRVGADAAVRGVADVAAAVTASTLTTVAVFAPIVFVEGVAGELFGDLALAVVSSLVASLVVALVVVPVLAAVELDALRGERGAPLLGVYGEQASGGWWSRAWSSAVHGPRSALAADLAWCRGGWPTRWLALPYQLARFCVRVLARGGLVLATGVALVSARVAVALGGLVIWPARRLALLVADAFQTAYVRVERAYGRLLARALRRGVTVLVVAACVSGVAGYAARGLGMELLPTLHQGRFIIDVALPVGTPLVTTARRVALVEQLVSSTPGVQTVYTTIGADTRADTRADEGSHTARLRVALTPGGDLAAREDAAMDTLREEIAALGLVPRFSRPALFSVRTPVEVVVFGFELVDLQVASREVIARLGQVDGLADVSSSLSAGFPEVRIVYDRTRLHRLGLDPATVAAQVRDKVQGVEATTMNQGERRVAMRVQLVERDRASIDQIQRLNINPALRPAIPLSAVADFEEAVGPSEIRRVDQQRAVVISANLEGFDLGTAGRSIASAMRDVPLPDGMTWAIAGQSEEMKASMQSLGFALGLAIFLVYVIMASTFENLVHPLVILFSVPLAAVGAVLALGLFGQAISVVVFIGLIVLAGVVVNNAIVLVDAINRLRQKGFARDAAIAEAGRLRLRPILITTATTVLGLAPLALGLGAGAEMQGPLAVTVIGGLSSSTLLTLLVIPIVYRLVTRAEAAAESVVDDVGVGQRA